MTDKLYKKHYGNVVVVSDLNRATRSQIKSEVVDGELKMGKAVLVRFNDDTVGVSIICTRKEMDHQYERIIHEASDCNSIREWALKHTGKKRLVPQQRSKAKKSKKSKKFKKN